VHEEESGGHASDLLERTLIAEQCTFCEVVLHADNGAPMKSQTLRSKMLELGVTPSYSRLYSVNYLVRSATITLSGSEMGG